MAGLILALMLMADLYLIIKYSQGWGFWTDEDPSSSGVRGYNWGFIKAAKPDVVQKTRLELRIIILVISVLMVAFAWVCYI
jgi:hypothetical protein